MTAFPQRPPITANRLIFRHGAIRLTRRGNLNIVDQTRGKYADRAPEPRGLWAFPFPYFDDFFAQHKWDEVVPRHLQRAQIPDDLESQELAQRLWHEREQWIRAHHSTMPLRHFWWEGSLYARFNQDGNMAQSADDFIYQGWFLLTLDEYANAARRVEPGAYYSRDHMEVFLSPRFGRIVGR